MKSKGIKGEQKERRYESESCHWPGPLTDFTWLIQCLFKFVSFWSTFKRWKVLNKIQILRFPLTNRRSGKVSTLLPQGSKRLGWEVVAPVPSFIDKAWVQFAMSPCHWHMTCHLHDLSDSCKPLRIYNLCCKHWWGNTSRVYLRTCLPQDFRIFACIDENSGILKSSYIQN